MKPCPSCQWMLKDTDSSCNMCGASVGEGRAASSACSRAIAPPPPMAIGGAYGASAPPNAGYPAPPPVGVGGRPPPVSGFGGAPAPPPVIGFGGAPAPPPVVGFGGAPAPPPPVSGGYGGGPPPMSSGYGPPPPIQQAPSGCLSPSRRRRPRRPTLRPRPGLALRLLLRACCSRCACASTDGGPQQAAPGGFGGMAAGAMGGIAQPAAIGFGAPPPMVAAPAAWPRLRR